MIGPLAINRHSPQTASRVERGRQNYLLKQRAVDMVRAAKRRQRSSGFEQFEGPKVNLLISPQSVRNRRSISRKGRRVQDDEVEARDHLFVRTRGRLGFEPVEDVSTFERTLFRQSVLGSIPLGRPYRFGALIDTVNM